MPEEPRVTVLPEDSQPPLPEPDDNEVKETPKTGELGPAKKAVPPKVEVEEDVRVALRAEPTEIQQGEHVTLIAELESGAAAVESMALVVDGVLHTSKREAPLGGSSGTPRRQNPRSTR